MSKKIRQTVVLNKETDQDILDWLAAHSENKSEAIRDAIRAGMGLVQPKRPVTLEDVLVQLAEIKSEIKRRSFMANGGAAEAEPEPEEPKDIADLLDGLGL